MRITAYVDAELSIEIVNESVFGEKPKLNLYEFRKKKEELKRKIEQTLRKLKLEYRIDEEAGETSRWTGRTSAWARLDIRILSQSVNEEEPTLNLYEFVKKVEESTKEIRQILEELNIKYYLPEAKIRVNVEYAF